MLGFGIAEGVVLTGDTRQRREFIKVLGGVAVALPVSAHAQQPKQMRRIGVILPANTENAEFQAFLASFLQGMALLGWTFGHTVQIDTRWAGANADDIRKHATE